MIRSILLAGLFFLACSLTAQTGAYRLSSSFPQPGDSLQIGKASAIDIDFAGNIYLVDRDRHQLFKFSPEGRLIRVIGGFGRGEEAFDDPRDVCAGATLDIYIADYNNNRVVRYDKNFNFLNELRSVWPEPYQFDRVLSVAVSPQGDLFLLEDGMKRIIKFGRGNEPIEVFGGIDETYGQLLDPVQITLESNKYIFASDPAQQAVVVFDYLGNFITTLTHPQLSQPTGLHWGPDQRLYVVDRESSQVFVFSTQFKFVGIIQFSERVEPLIDVAVRYQKRTGERSIYALSPNRCYQFDLIR